MQNRVIGIETCFLQILFNIIKSEILWISIYSTRSIFQCDLTHWTENTQGGREHVWAICFGLMMRHPCAELPTSDAARAIRSMQQYLKTSKSACQTRGDCLVVAHVQSFCLYQKSSSRKHSQLIKCKHAAMESRMRRMKLSLKPPAKCLLP